MEKILPFADSADEGLRQAALFALASLGDPAAGPTLSRSRIAASHRERAGAPALYLLYARRLLESGRKTEGLEAARAVLESYPQAGESHHASAALALLVSSLGAAALPDLQAAAGSPDRALRGSALNLAERIPGGEATLRFVETAATAPPDLRADIVAMLGLRGDAAALPFVRESLRSPDEAVRRAAIPAATRLGGATVLPDLLPLLGSAGATENALLKTALLGYPAPLVVPEASRLLDAAPPAAKATLIEVLGEKGAHGEIDRVFHLIESQEPPIREASLRALANLAGDPDLPRLVSMLEEATLSDTVVRLREAIAAAVLRNPDPERRADSLLALLKSTTPAGRVEILKVLPRIGGVGPLRAAVAETASPDPAVQSAAVGALSRWPDPAAVEELVRIASTTKSREQRRLAVQGYARLVARSSGPAATRVLGLEKALALSADDADRLTVLNELTGVREPESLRLLGRCLDRPGLRAPAAAALFDLASRQSPEERWLSGPEAYSVLRRAQASLEDPATRERAEKTLLDLLRQGGFVPLLGGSLDAWKGSAMPAHSSLADGVLALDGKGEGLRTKGDYADFELLADWKIEKGGRGAVSLRDEATVLISDPEANPAGSGGLAYDQEGKHLPLEKADLPMGDWNAFRIVLIGERVTVYLNDKRTVDGTVLENQGKGEKPGGPKGPIELRAEGAPLWFRNVFVREIPRETTVPAMSDVEANHGFTALFNGRDLEGWTGPAAGYAAENGRIVVHPERGGGNLYTAKEYRNFVLRFDFQLTPAANNGVGIRAPLEGDAAYLGMEVQILEDASPVYWGLQPYQYHGSIYGVVPARRGVLRPVGEWNSEEIAVRERRVTVVVNGTTVVDADLDLASAGGAMDGKDHPGLKRASGHIAFLGHGSALEFRNLRIKELP